MNHNFTHQDIKDFHAKAKQFQAFVEDTSPLESTYLGFVSRAVWETDDDLLDPYKDEYDQSEDDLSEDEDRDRRKGTIRGFSPIFVSLTTFSFVTNRREVAKIGGVPGSRRQRTLCQSFVHPRALSKASRFGVWSF
jgi:hypothetical protein